MINKYYFDEISLFRSFVEKRVTIEELNAPEANFVFSTSFKDGIITNQVFPSFLVIYNTEKPKYTPLAAQAEYVDYESIDNHVKESWQQFQSVIKEAIAANRVIFSDGKNYPAKIMGFIKQGHECYLNGRWQKFEEVKYLLEQL